MFVEGWRLNVPKRPVNLEEINNLPIYENYITKSSPVHVSLAKLVTPVLFRMINV